MARDYSLRLFSLNVNGLRSTVKRKSVFRYIKEKQFDIACLQESYVTDDVSEKWKMEWGGDFVSNNFNSHSCGQIILLRKNVFDNVVVLKSSRRILVVQVKFQNKKIIIVNVYAPNCVAEKNRFFEELTEVIRNLDSEQIVVCGDFNCTLNDDLDNISGEKHPRSNITHFNDLVAKCDLYDTWRLFHPQDKAYTWCRNKPFLARRLDYIFVNSNTFEKTIESSILSLSSTDHRGCSIVVKLSDMERGPGYWKLNNNLLNDIDYVNQVNTLIDEYVHEITDEADYQMEWEMLKVKIKTFTSNYSKLKSAKRRNLLVKMYDELDTVEKELARNPDRVTLHSKRIKIKLEIELAEQHRVRAAQTRARVKWVEEGEKNTKYFLGLEKSRANAKIMEEVYNENGTLVSKQSEIVNVQKRYFSNLYKDKVNSQGLEQKVEQFIRTTTIPTLSEEQKNSCEGQVTESELLNALKQMKNGSAPGCDGITTEFIKVFWTHIGNLLTKVFNSSFEKKSLSSNQRKGIITLIHKGKDLPRNNLKNWRPISLMNSDYKLLAKCLAIRLSCVIDDIVNNDQVAYIRGRQVSSLLRLIDDIIEQTDVMQKHGLLFAVDLSQAFDSISKPYILIAFKKFGFGDSFCQWVETLMADTKSCMNYCGWLTEYFSVDSGIRQGCPFSPLAFILALELVAIRIRESRDVQGISILDTLIKIALYADDITLFLQDEQDMYHALDIFQEFSEISGLKINKVKSEAMWLGTRKESLDSFFGYTWKRRLKILGICFANDKSASLIEENWLNKVESIKRVIHTWEKRNLSIMGKILIAKTFLLSQFVYVIQAISIPNVVLVEINRLLFRFIWRKKDCNRRAFEKVKRTVLCSEYERGGLNMINIIQMQRAALLHWVARLTSASNDEKWKSIVKSIFKSFGPNLICFYSNVKWRNFKGIHQIKSCFWKSVLQAWLDENKHDLNQPVPTFLWNNSFMKHQGAVLFFPDWIKANVLSLGDVHGPDGFITFHDVCQKIGQSASRILEYYAVRAAVHQFQRRNTNNTTDIDLQNIPVFNGKRIASYKEFRKALEIDSSVTPCSHTFWNRKLGKELTKETWLIPRITTKETRLRVLQWKIIHNIYPTNILLCKMRVTDSRICSYCPDKIDYMEHFFYECPVVLHFWKSVKQYILINYGTQIDISVLEALFGVPKTRDIPLETLQKINHLILIAKMCISIYKKTNSKAPLSIIFENQLNI